MGEPDTPNREQVAETFAAVRTSLRTERRRTATERQAFETFMDRVGELELSNSSPNPSPTGGRQGDRGTALMASGRTAQGERTPTAAVRRAYEETVMAISFYDEEYGEEYAESVRAEFGPQVATALTTPGCFGPAARAALTAAIERAVEERELLIQTCERELDCVDTAADTLLSVAAALDTVAATDPGDSSFGTLEARWHQLARLERRCEAAVADRQSTIEDHRSRHGLPVDAPDICAYLYESHESPYPVLAAGTDLARRVTRLQTAYERAMARC